MLIEVRREIVFKKRPVITRLLPQIVMKATARPIPMALDLIHTAHVRSERIAIDEMRQRTNDKCATQHYFLQ